MVDYPRDSATLAISYAAATFWGALQVSGIDVRLGKVGSKMNIADIPDGDPPLFPDPRKNCVRRSLQLMGFSGNYWAQSFRGG